MFKITEQYLVSEPYGKMAVELYVHGCTRACSGCHNPELKEFKEMSQDEFVDILRKLLTRREFFDIISITGGDLLCQSEHYIENLLFILSGVFADKEIWLFTGEDDINKVPSVAKNCCSYIKLGHYDETLKQSGFPASSNQKLLKKGVDY